MKKLGYLLLGLVLLVPVTVIRGANYLIDLGDAFISNWKLNKRLKRNLREES